jgi:hypothetical protein
MEIELQEKTKVINSLDKVVMSSFGGIEFKSKEQLPTPEFKPKGLWYGIGTSWIDWVRNEMPEWEKDNLFKLDIDESKIIKITNEDELLNFSNKFSKKHLNSSYITSIKWNEVSKEYGGIEITPYLHSMRRDNRVFWYYGWDVASGCIWRKDVIKGIKKIF